MSNAVPLPAGSTLGKSFEYGLDVNLGTFEVPSWQSFRRISGFAPTYTPTLQDAATYDDLGSPNEDVTAWAFALAFIAQVNRAFSTGEYLPEVEYLLARTRPSAKGSLAVADVRWYHKPETGTPNPLDAGRGFCTVQYTRQNTGAEGAIEQFAFSLTGKGPYTPISNPFAGWDLVAPTISSIDPDGAGSGELITITGTGFTGVTDVTVDGSTPEYSVVSGSSIIAVLPTDAAGDVDVIVTNAVGASSAYSFTRGA